MHKYLAALSNETAPSFWVIVEKREDGFYWFDENVSSRILFMAALPEPTDTLLKSLKEKVITRRNETIADVIWKSMEEMKIEGKFRENNPLDWI